LGQAAEVRRSDERSRVIEALKKAGGPLSVTDIMAGADIPKRGNADQLLSKMAGDGDIERVGRGKYALPGQTSTPPERSVRTMRSGQQANQASHKSEEFSSTDLTGNLTDNLIDPTTTNLTDLTNLSDLTNLTDLIGPSRAMELDSSPPLGPPGDSLDDFY